MLSFVVTWCQLPAATGVITGRRRQILISPSQAFIGRPAKMLLGIIDVVFSLTDALTTLMALYHWCFEAHWWWTVLTHFGQGFETSFDGAYSSSHPVAACQHCAYQLLSWLPQSKPCCSMAVACSDNCALLQPLRLFLNFSATEWTYCISTVYIEHGSLFMEALSAKGGSIEVVVAITSLSRSWDEDLLTVNAFLLNEVSRCLDGNFLCTFFL